MSDDRPLEPTPEPQPTPTPHHPVSPPPEAERKSKKGLWIALGCLGCGGLALVLLFAFGGLAWLLTRDGEEREVEPVVVEESAVPTATYVNTPEGLTGDLAANFVPFSFEYPTTWEVVETGREPGASNFVKVEKQVEEGFTAENFAVGYLTLPPGAENDREVLRPLLEALRGQFAQSFPNFQAIGTGPAVLGGREGLYLTFSSRVEGTPRGDVDLWGRVFLIPVGGGRGVAVVMMGTPVGTELSGPADLGQKGELPVVINSFRFGDLQQAAAPAPTPAAAPATAPAGSADGTYAAGDAVQILWEGQWYPGRVLEADGSRYKIRYDGYDESWDEWVTSERLRRS